MFRILAARPPRRKGNPAPQNKERPPYSKWRSLVSHRQILSFQIVQRDTH
jgi:hypothetical protein